MYISNVHTPVQSVCPSEQVLGDDCVQNNLNAHGGVVEHGGFDVLVHEEGVFMTTRKHEEAERGILWPWPEHPIVEARR